jgi:maltooligosyltrehalose trehalohydrolase
VSGGVTRFGAFTTTATACSVRLFAPDGRALATHEMKPLGGGFFEAALETEREGVGHGALYKFVLGDQAFPDPYARHLPQGVHGPAMVVEPRYSFRFEGVHRPLAAQVIYELHVGTFTEEGTYAAAISRLGDLVRLGITSIELMPLSSFPGARGWGYDGVAHYAPFAPYGAPDDLRRFVDEAHGLGLSVLLDVVYNHFGPSGNYLYAYSGEYFTREIQTAWGDAPNFFHPVMRRYVIENALYWLRDYRFDGLRLDAIHAIVDRSPRHILRELADEVAALAPRKLLIAEDDRNDPADITSLGLDGVWADDFHHQVRVTLTGERDGYYAAYKPGVDGIADAINKGWLYEGQIYPSTGKSRGKSAAELDASAFLYCIQNHDQIGNRALGERLSKDVSLEAYCSASMLLLFLPMTPLLFMGQEWAASSPFLYFTDHDEELGKLVSQGRREEFKAFAAFSDPKLREQIPDPQAPETFTRSKLAWNEREAPGHDRVLALYRRLLALRQTDAVLRESGREGLRAAAYGDALAVERRSGPERRLLLVNFSGAPLRLSSLPVSTDGLLSVLSSGEIADGDILPAWTSVLFAGKSDEGGRS